MTERRRRTMVGDIFLAVLIAASAATSPTCCAVLGVSLHKFHLGQTVANRARYAPAGAYVVTAKLPGARWRIRISHPEYG